jgi:hypothetical protein
LSRQAAHSCSCDATFAIMCPVQDATTRHMYSVHDRAGLSSATRDDRGSAEAMMRL